MLGLAALGVAGCSSDDDGSGGAGGGGSCAADTRKDTYTAGLTKTNGSLSVRLVEASPGPPIKGMNTITIELLDLAGTPLVLTDAEGKLLPGVTLTVTPWMPDHAHGSARKPVITPSGNGRFVVSEVWLAMAGLWSLKVDVTTPNGGAQKAAFEFCLDG
jgi:hypothetical protein